MLDWLVKELSWAEQVGVSVIILGHIPTCRSDCMKAFSWNFYRIIDRYEVGYCVSNILFTYIFSDLPDLK